MSRQETNGPRWRRLRATMRPLASANASSNTSLARSTASVTADDSAAVDLVVACMADSSRDPVSEDYAPVWLIEAVWDAGGVHSIIQAEATSWLGLTQALGGTNMDRLYPIPDDFEATIRILTEAEGGRKTSPFNGIRWDFSYVADNTTDQLYM